MNKANNVLIGVLTSFDNISHTGEIRIVDTDSVVYISKKYSLINLPSPAMMADQDISQCNYLYDIIERFLMNKDLQRNNCNY